MTGSPNENTDLRNIITNPDRQRATSDRLTGALVRMAIGDGEVQLFDYEEPDPSSRPSVVGDHMYRIPFGNDSGTHCAPIEGDGF